MNNKELLEKLMNKAIELYCISERGREIYGESFFEFTERGMRIVNPEELIVKIDGSKKQIKEFKKKLKKEMKKIK